jgi:cytochrome d ubiquinol oxidase subunit II
MFENLSQEILQTIWWMIVSLLGSILVFLMFVQGGQTFLFSIGKQEAERSLLINSVGRKWELAFTTLVTFGGAFFASFPLFYATSFGGAYWVWMLILFSFIVQAVSYEYRKKPNNFLGTKTFDIFLLFNGIVAPLAIGAAVGTFFTGSPFSVNESHLSQWMNPALGLEALLDYRNVLLGLTVLFLTRVLGLQYFMNSISDEKVFAASKKCLLRNSIIFVVLFLAFAGVLLSMSGYAVNPTNNTVSMEAFKYLHNFLQMPLVLVAFLVGVILVLGGIALNLFKNSTQGIWATGLGTIITVFSLFMVAGLNNTAYYPSYYDLQSSLTIHNSSSSHYTLTAMSYVALSVPFVVAYIGHVWNLMNKKKIDTTELKSEEKKY